MALREKGEREDGLEEASEAVVLSARSLVFPPRGGGGRVGVIVVLLLQLLLLLEHTEVDGLQWAAKSRVVVRLVVQRNFMVKIYRSKNLVKIHGCGLVLLSSSKLKVRRNIMGIIYIGVGHLMYFVTPLG